MIGINGAKAMARHCVILLLDMQKEMGGCFSRKFEDLSLSESADHDERLSWRLEVLEPSTGERLDLHVVSKLPLQMGHTLYDARTELRGQMVKAWCKAVKK